MLLVIAGAGASYDSVPARPVGLDHPSRPPLADQLFESREFFLGMQRAFPGVLQVAAQLSHRKQNQTVEDVLELFAGQQSTYTERLPQLAATRYYIQSVVAHCESGWVGDAPVSTNMHSLVDRIEAVRLGRARPAFVTFNYDRLVERALEGWGRRFASLGSYVEPEAIPVFKLHGSVDWCRYVQALSVDPTSGDLYSVMNQICRSFQQVELGPIELASFRVPLWRVNDSPVIPAIAVPLKKKTTFECPDAHIEKLKSLLPAVRAVLTVGWRGGEEHFLELLRTCARKSIEAVCVAGSEADAQATVRALRTAIHGNVAAFGHGFSEFLRTNELDRLLNCTWTDN